MSTRLPTDLFTPTEGSTYLLDGYPDTAYGEGTALKWDSATVRGLAGIPDGVIGGDVEWESDKAAAINYEGFVLPEELEADVHYDVIDHTWLDPEQPQDGSRLPKTPHVALPQLEEAWGKGRRTDGIHLVAAVDKGRADYEASLKTEKKASTPKAKIAEAVSRAWRRVTAGTDLRTVGTEITSALGDDAPRAKAAFDEMRREAGLVGRVYIRADAYPKCASGTWSDTVRKTACDAQYVQSKPECDGCFMAQQGRCAAFGGRRLVTTVPYAQALEAYGPRIAAAGVRVASGDPKEVLRRGLREASNRKADAPATNFHVVSDAEAARSLRATAIPSAVRTPDEVRRERQLTAVQHRIARYVRDGLIAREDAAHLVRSVTDPAEMLRRATAVAARPKSASAYTGSENDLVVQAADRGLSSTKTPVVSRDDHRRRVHVAIDRWQREGLLTDKAARSLLASAADPSDVVRAAADLISAAGHPAPKYEGFIQQDFRNSTRVGTGSSAREVNNADIRRDLREADGRALRAQKVVEGVASDRERATTRAARRASTIAGKVAAVVAEIDRGVRGSALAGFIHRTIAPDEVREASVALDPVLRRTTALSEGPAKARAYVGPTYEAAPQFARTASEPAHGEVARLTRWARRLMAEGVAGSELDHRIAARFASGVRTAGTNSLSALRREHEGLSGHLYVDAAAYATKTGTGGCEEGARHHRANGVPTVLEMPEKCGGCIHRTARKDGTVSCSVYAKPLVASAAEVVADPARHQRDMIRIADAPDQDVTASLFSNTFDPTEFALGLDSELDHVEVDDMPEHEAVGQYMFGGIVLD